MSIISWTTFIYVNSADVFYIYKLFLTLHRFFTVKRLFKSEEEGFAGFFDCLDNVICEL